MPRNKKSSNSLVDINFSESFMSLIFGAVVVLIAVFFVFTSAKNKTHTDYDKINTAISTFQEPQKIAEENIQTPERQSIKTYEVKRGENLWTIAEKVYGSGYNWVDLARVNNLKNPGLIFAGNKLVIPVVQKITVTTVQPTQNKGPSISGSNYTIVKGDNLWNISVRRYGDGYKWPEIARINSIPNPNLIYADNTLKLP